MIFARFLLAPMLVALTALPAMAQKLTLPELSDYINGLTTLEAEFTQINDDETISTGKILINRPGTLASETNKQVEFRSDGFRA